MTFRCLAFAFFFVFGVEEKEAETERNVFELLN
jgi:hypothetical protein